MENDLENLLKQLNNEEFLAPENRERVEKILEKFANDLPANVAKIFFDALKKRQNSNS